MPTVTIYGNPAPKGSMKCIGARGRTGHQLVEDHRPGQKDWRKAIRTAGASILEANGEPYMGPIAVRVVFTLARPKSVPVILRWWPFRKPTADLDKLARMVLDGLADGGCYADDVQVVHLSATKRYPDTPRAAAVIHDDEALAEPGAVITIRPPTPTNSTPQTGTTAPTTSDAHETPTHTASDNNSPCSKRTTAP